MREWRIKRACLLFSRIKLRRTTALLIDGDNIPPSAVPSILDELCQDRRPDVVRVFLGRSTTQWQQIAEENGLELVIVSAPVPGKNSVDLAIAVDAMNLAHTKNVAEIILATSDSDFAYLAHKLRELGKSVRGIGADHTALAFRTACSRFTVLSDIWAKSGARVPKGERNRKLKDAKRKIIQYVQQRSDAEGWANVTKLETFLRERDATFDPRSLGFRNFTLLLRAMPEIEVDRTRWALKLLPAKTRRRSPAGDQM